MTEPTALVSVWSIGEGTRVVFLLLVSAHVLADFALQWAQLAEAKERSVPALLGHVGLVFSVHVLLLIPALGWGVTGVLVALAVAHGIQDGIRSRLMGARGRTAVAFVVDQAVHIVFALLGTYAVIQLVGDADFFPGGVPARTSALARLAIIASGYVFVLKGGSTLVERLLGEYPEIPEKAGTGRQHDYRMGRVIGYLERLIVLTLVLHGQWAAIGLVVAAKSVARFPELKDQAFSDYYLIGTLMSMAVAVAVGIAVRWLI